MKQIQVYVAGYFKAISESFFFDNAVFGIGLLILLLIFNRDLFVFGMITSLIGYGYSIRYSAPKALKRLWVDHDQLFFFGLAMTSLFQKSPVFYFFLVMGALGIPLVTKAVFEVLQHWKLSPLVISYVLMVWVIWLCGHGTTLESQPENWQEKLLLLPSLSTELAPGMRVLNAVLQSMGRLLFLPNSLFGLLVLFLVTVCSPRRGLFFFLGTLVATVTAFFITSGSTAWEYGYFSFSAGLIGLGLSSFQEKYSLRTILLFCILSSFLTVAVDQFLKGVQLPSLSLPYVLTLWVALLSRAPRLSLSWAPANAGFQSSPLLQKPVLSLDRLVEPTQDAEKVA